jgi:transcriptional adapter 2-alpha
MGLIKKKTAVRTTEGGIKYICDICSADITATVRCFHACLLLVHGLCAVY